MITRLRPIALAALSLILACGSGTPTGNNNNPGGNANFTAKINGTTWTSATAATAANGNANGTFTVIGGTLVPNAPTMSLTLYNIGAPGTYPLGVGGTVVGGTAVVSEGANSWWTPLSGAAGTVTITAVSATHLAGTFSFVGEPFLGNASGNRTVTNGSFDLPVTSSVSVAVPDNKGSKFGGTLGGSPWNAATVVMVAAPTSGVLTIGASNTTYNVTIIASGYTGVGTYALNTGAARTISVLGIGGTPRSWSTDANATGSIIVTSATATRIKGSYTATFPAPAANPGIGSMTLSGTFDVGVP